MKEGKVPPPSVITPKKAVARVNVCAPAEFVAMVDEVAQRLGISKAMLFRIAAAVFIEREGLRNAKDGQKPHKESGEGGGERGCCVR